MCGIDSQAYMGMDFFSGEGLDLIFPLGGGAIFQPRGGLSNGIFCEQMLIWGCPEMTSSGLTK